MPRFLIHPTHLIRIPVHLVIMDIIIGVRVNQEKRRIQAAVRIPQLDDLIVPARDVRLDVRVKQIARSPVGQRLIDLAQCSGQAFL